MVFPTLTCPKASWSKVALAQQGEVPSKAPQLFGSGAGLMYAPGSSQAVERAGRGLSARDGLGDN